MDDVHLRSPLLPSDQNSSSSRVFSALLIIPVILLATRFLSGQTLTACDASTGLSKPRMPAYWAPFFGHLFSFLWDANKLMESARDHSEGIYSLYMAGKRMDIITDPILVKSALAQKQSSLPFEPIAWAISKRFFGIPRSALAKTHSVYDSLTHAHQLLMKDPSLDDMVRATVRNLCTTLPTMITFSASPVDQHPWETWAKADNVSPESTDLNLMALCRDVLGHASVSALFGRALLENHPHLLHDVYDLDAGMKYFLMGLPAWVPWPSSMKAHYSRAQVWAALADFNRAHDAVTDGKEAEPKWGDMADVSEYIKTRCQIMRDTGLAPQERADVSILWALVANANLMVYWHLLHVLACPELVERLREEIAPFAYATEPVRIGSHSSPPGLELDHEGLAKKCPLLRSTFLEACRLSVQDWSVREIAEDVVLRGAGGKRGDVKDSAFLLRRGGILTIPHNMHMLDGKYFPSPSTFQPERFIVERATPAKQTDRGTDESNSKTSTDAAAAAAHSNQPSLGTDPGTSRPFGGGASMCKGRVLAERECLAFVAGVLVLWDVEPLDEHGAVTSRWTIPRQVKTTAVSLPVADTRVRVRQRRFAWDE